MSVSQMERANSHHAQHAFVDSGHVMQHRAETAMLDHLQARADSHILRTREIRDMGHVVAGSFEEKLLEVAPDPAPTVMLITAD